MEIAAPHELPLTAPSEALYPREQVVTVMDFGGQYIDLVVKAVERQGFIANMVPADTPVEQIEASSAAVIMSGSPSSAHTDQAPRTDPAFWQTKLPTLGICYGQQAMVQAFGGKVETGLLREDGPIVTELDITHPVFEGINPESRALFTHGDFVTELPAGFKAIGSHRHVKEGQTVEVISAIAKDNFVGVQFHPEVFDDTPSGYEIFDNFLTKFAGLEPNQELLDKRIEAQISQIQQEIVQKVGDRHVIALVSGGIDSLVGALLAAGVIDPRKLHMFFINNGFMRDEDEAVIEMLRASGLEVSYVDAEEQFSKATTTFEGVEYGPLWQEVNPQGKRLIIGEKFVDYNTDLIAGLNLHPDDTILLQGTNAADRIESGYSKGGNRTATIKTHHNMVEGIQGLKARNALLQPLEDLFKDEIRRLGEGLGLPEEVVWRQPFPGPGLAIRILGLREGEYQEHSANDQKAVDDFLQAREADRHLNSLLLPVRSVGVGGDSRSHISAVALQGRPNWANMAQLAQDLPQNFGKLINRVVYALGNQPLDYMQPTSTDLGPATRAQLKHADRISFEMMREYGLMRHIRQFPVVLLPLSFGYKGDRSIVLRPVTTSTFMTARAMLPEIDLPTEFVYQTAQRILQEVPGISQVFLDLTNKPPGTTEWE
jgi:GMP synthase (glutamine-hydrolysing)